MIENELSLAIEIVALFKLRPRYIAELADACIYDPAFMKERNLFY
jgi:hypothetical protein